MKNLRIFFFLVIIALPAVSHAQGCAVCTKTASSLDNKSARGLNGGILYLAFLPITILSTIGFVWWRHQRA